MAAPTSVVVLGAGVIGLTTAVELLRQHPTASITIVAKHLPGDQSSADYCSNWAGANWMSYEDDKSGSTQQAGYECVAFQRFGAIVSPSNGVRRFPLRLLYNEDDVATHGLKSLRQNWFQDLLGGTTEVKKEELPDRVGFGLELRMFMINPSVYLAWYAFTFPI